MGLPKERWEAIKAIAKNPGRQVWHSASLGPIRRLEDRHGEKRYGDVHAYWSERMNRSIGKLKKA